MAAIESLDEDCDYRGEAQTPHENQEGAFDPSFLPFGKRVELDGNYARKKKDQFSLLSKTSDTTFVSALGESSWEDKKPLAMHDKYSAWVWHAVGHASTP